MAKLEDILELQKAGFTADEIAKLVPLIKEEPQIIKEEPKQEPALSKEPESDKVVDKLDELIKKIELNGVYNSQQPHQSQQSLEEIMANIINPQ